LDKCFSLAVILALFASVALADNNTDFSCRLPALFYSPDLEYDNVSLDTKEDDKKENISSETDKLSYNTSILI
jgi:hypothetical protein